MVVLAVGQAAWQPCSLFVIGMQAWEAAFCVRSARPGCSLSSARKLQVSLSTWTGSPWLAVAHTRQRPGDARVQWAVRRAKFNFVQIAFSGRRLPNLGHCRPPATTDALTMCRPQHREAAMPDKVSIQSSPDFMNAPAAGLNTNSASSGRVLAPLGVLHPCAITTIALTRPSSTNSHNPCLPIQFSLAHAFSICCRCQPRSAHGSLRVERRAHQST